MEIGELNKRISIGNITVGINSNGFKEEVWTEHCGAWAKVQNLFGREFFSAMSVQAEKTVKFTIRYRADIDESMRILFKGRYFNITFIDDIKYGHKFIEIKAMEVV